MTYDGTGLLIGEIEKVYAERLQQYARFLIRYEPWISATLSVDQRSRRCEWSAPANTSATGTHGDSDFQGPECLSENIIVEGTYDGKQTTTSALAPFFNRIFNKSGVRRETFDLLPL